MNILSKKTTPSQNIAFLGMMAALNLVFSLIASFFPISALFLMLFLPLVSAFAAILADPRYMPLYIIASLGLSIAVTSYDFQNTLFYTFPAIIMGSCYGFCLRYKFPVAPTLFLLSILEMSLSYAALPIIKTVYGVDTITFLIKLIGFEGNPTIYQIVPSAMFTYGLISTALVHLISSLALSRFGLSFKENKNLNISSPLLSMGFLGIAFSLITTSPQTTYIFILFSYYFAFFSILNLIEFGKVYLGVFAISLFIGCIFLFAFFYTKMPEGTGIALLGLFSISISLPALLGDILKRKDNKDVPLS